MRSSRRRDISRRLSFLDEEDGMSFQIDLSGRVAVVTGSSRGLGRAIATALADAGADVCVTSRKRESLEEVCQEIENKGRDVLGVELDVREKESIEAMAAQVIEHFGKADILVNNAGTNVRKPALEMTWDDWDTVLDTNLRSVFFCSQALVPSMIKRKWGRVINIGSATSIMGFPNISPYCASRGAIVQLTKSLAVEWGPRGVNVNVLGPGWFRTEQTRVLWENDEWMSLMKKRIPNGHIARPEELGAAAVFLASDAASYVNGTLWMVDGGFTTGGEERIIPIRSKKKM
jgi:NAD(P)-dependent dehydrogenase (short-subunit alcohol dehydrogenase family)